MNNNFSTLQLLKKDSFRFDPLSCRRENIKLVEAKFLRWVFLAERSNAEVIQNFGMGLAYNLLKLGYVDNPMGERDNAHTNLWKPTAEGIDLLKRIMGEKP